MGFAVLVVGCTSTAIKNTPAEKAAFLDDLIKNSEKRSAVSGNILLTTEMNGKSVTLPGVMLVEYPDKVHLEVQDPVGGIQALLVLNRDRFWFYRQSAGDILTGPIAKLPASLLGAMASSDAARIFLARPPAERLKSAAVNDGSAVLGAEKNSPAETGQSWTETISWEGNLAEPTGWEKRSADGDKAVLDAKYEKYEFKSGLRYPTQIRFSSQFRDEDARHVLVAWKDWEPSVPESKKLFQIPQQETFGRKIKELR